MQDNETLKNIKMRRSVRAYKPEQIMDCDLNAVIEAGLYAPFAEEDSRFFSVIRNSGMLSSLNSAAKEFARNSDMPWLVALGQDMEFNCLYGAPTVIIISGSEGGVALEMDCAAAAENMLIAAESLGIGSCWIYFSIMAFSHPDANKLKTELKIPEGYKPVISIALGFEDGQKTAPPCRNADRITYID